LFRFLPAVEQELQQLAAENERRPAIVNGRQSLFEPISDRIFVKAKQTRDLFNGVIPVNFDQSRVETPFAHLERPSPAPVSAAARTTFHCWLAAYSEVELYWCCASQASN
jgi:hypothetical protein